MIAQELAARLVAYEAEWHACPTNERATRPGLWRYLAQRLLEDGIVRVE